MSPFVDTMQVIAGGAGIGYFGLLQATQDCVHLIIKSLCVV